MQRNLARSRDDPGETLPKAPPIDHVHLCRYTLGCPELEREVLSLFAGQAPHTLAQLVAAESVEPWRSAAHTLKGSARSVGAWRVAEAATYAEALPGCHASPQRDTAIACLRHAVAEAIEYIACLTAQAN